MVPSGSEALPLSHIVLCGAVMTRSGPASTIGGRLEVLTLMVAKSDAAAPELSVAVRRKRYWPSCRPDTPSVEVVAPVSAAVLGPSSCVHSYCEMEPSGSLATPTRLVDVVGSVRYLLPPALTT